MQTLCVARPLAAAARLPASRAALCASSCGAVRRSTTWLQGKPPAVSHSAGTVAAFYYKNVREFDIPTKDFIAAVGQDLKMTVAQFDRQVYAYSLGMLEAWSLKQGHKIGIWCTNEIESAIAQYAAALIGIEAVVIDPGVGFPGVKELINSEGLRALLLSSRHGSEERHEALSTEFDQELAYTAETRGYSPIASKRFRSLRYLACTSGEFVNGVMRFNELPVYGQNGSYDHDEIAAVQAYITPDQPALTYVSAGPDGSVVKGRSVSHEEVLAGAAAAGKAVALTGSDVLLSTAPVWTFAGLTSGVLAGSSSACKVVLPGKAFSAADTLLAAELHRPTVLVLTPEHAAAVAAESTADASKPEGQRQYEGALSSVRAGIVVTAPGAPAQPMSLGAVKLLPVDAATGL